MDLGYFNVAFNLWEMLFYFMFQPLTMTFSWSLQFISNFDDELFSLALW